jgi:predicted nucleic acid-binding protein
VILLDSTVIFDYTRGTDARLAGWFKKYPVAICEIVRSEVLHGARSPSDRTKLIALLSVFAHVPLPESIWDAVGDNLAILRSNGVTVPFQDAVLTTLAISIDVELWTRDKHFSLIQKWLPPLKLFQEPP